MRIPLPLPQHRDRAASVGLRTGVGDALAGWRAWAPRACSIVLAVALLVQLLRIAGVGLDAWLAAPAGFAAPAVPAAALPPLPQTDLFFRHAEHAAPAEGSAEALGYTLFGVRSGGDTASAILAGKDGKQVSWTVGSELAPGITLDAVGADHAVLLAADGRHRLDLALATSLARIAMPASSPPAGEPPVPSAAPETSAAPTASAPTAATTPASTPSATTAPAGGYTLPAGGHDMALRLAGLKPGDVVLSVNGKPLNPERLGNLKDELKGTSAVTIRYMRGDETRSVSLPVPR